jgi:hypothetical protein
VEQSQRLQILALGLSPVLLLLAIPASGGSAPYLAFLALLVEQSGSPVFFALGGLLAFYGYAWLKGLRGSEWAFAIALLLATVVDRRTVSLATLAAPQWWPLALLAGTEMTLGIIHRRSFPAFAGAVCAIAALSIGLKGTAFLEWGGAVPLHLLLGAALFVGMTFHDWFSLFLRRGGAVVLPVAALAALTLAAGSIPESGRLGYLVTMTAVSGACWFFAGDRWFAVAAGTALASMLLASLSSLHGTWNRQVSPRGFHALAGGALCFFLAALISAMKAGRIRRLMAGPGETESRSGSS